MRQKSRANWSGVILLVSAKAPIQSINRTVSLLVLPTSCHLEFLKMLVLTSFSELAMEPGEVRRKVQMFASKEESGDGYTSPKDRVYGSPPSNISR